MAHIRGAGREYRIAAAAVLLLGIGLCLTTFIRPALEGFFSPDYTVFWQAGRLAVARPSDLYDFEAITAAQSWVVTSAASPRPFVYPPSSLLLFVPLAFLPFAASYLLWVATSITAYSVAAKRLLSGLNLWLLLLSAPVALTVLPGQASLVIAAAVFASLQRLDHRPVLAGAILGIAAAIKPQALVLFPIACASSGHWRALAAFLTSGAAMVTASVLLFGWSLWVDWISAMGRFLDTVREMELVNISPVGLAHVLGLDGFAAMTIQLAGIVCGVSICWWAFRSPEAWVRIVGLVAGGIFCSPYAMSYEIAALAPVALLLLFSGRPWGLVGGLPLLGSFGFITVPLLALATVMNRRKERGAERPHEDGSRAVAADR